MVVPAGNRRSSATPTCFRGGTTASLAWLEELQPGADGDPRRFRPNVVIETEGGARGRPEITDYQGQPKDTIPEIEYAKIKWNSRAYLAIYGGLALWAAERARRAGPSLKGALGAFAVAVVAAVALAATMELREAWLTVALSLMLPAMILARWIYMT